MTVFPGAVGKTTSVLQCGPSPESCSGKAYPQQPFPLTLDAKCNVSQPA